MIVWNPGTVMLTIRIPTDETMQHITRVNVPNMGRKISSSWALTGAMASGYFVIGFNATSTTVICVRTVLYDLTRGKFSEICR
jgi:hypothetical protein